MNTLISSKRVNYFISFIIAFLVLGTFNAVGQNCTGVNLQNTLIPDCNTEKTEGDINKGDYQAVPVVSTAQYRFRTNCSSGNTSITGRIDNGVGTVVFTQNANNSCTDDEDITWQAGFSGTLAIIVREAVCAWNPNSAILRYRQVDNFTHTTSTALLCAGDSRTLTVGGTGTGGSYTLQSGPGSLAGDVYTADGGAGTVTVEYTLGACSESRVFEVGAPITADAGPDASVVFNSGPGPDPQPCVNLSASAAGGAGSFTFSWIPAAGLSDPNIADPEACPTVTTDYVVTATDANGCSTTDVVTVTAFDASNPPDSIIFKNNKNKILVCDQASCTTIAANANANCSSKNSLCYLLNNGATLGPCTCIPKRAMEDIAASFELKAYPNPVSSLAVIEFSTDNDEFVTLDVFDMKGAKVNTLFTGNVEAGRNYQAEFNANLHADNMYILRLTSANGVRTMKLVLLK